MELVLRNFTEISFRNLRNEDFRKLLGQKRTEAPKTPGAGGDKSKPSKSECCIFENSFSFLLFLNCVDFHWLNALISWSIRPELELKISVSGEKCSNYR